MDYSKLDKIVEDFINNNEFYISTLPIINEYSKNVFTEKIPELHKKCTKVIDLNDSIMIVYNFLNTLDSDLANQFLNIINLKDDNNKPYVNILPRSKYPEGLDEVRDGIVYIYYENTFNDCFVILHEMLHKMNECKRYNNEVQDSETFTRDYFGELVSITGEMMLGHYMLKNGIITEFDLNLRKANRLKTSKENARDIIIENELIKLKLQGKTINFKNLISILDDYDSNSIEYMIFMDEKNDMRRINSILKNNKMNLMKSQRYVIAQFLSSKLIKRNTIEDDFLRLHYALGDVNSNIMDVYDEIISGKTINK